VRLLKGGDRVKINALTVQENKIKKTTEIRAMSQKAANLQCPNLRLSVAQRMPSSSGQIPQQQFFCSR
jgi:hypothetical protein